MSEAVLTQWDIIYNNWPDGLIGLDNAGLINSVSLVAEKMLGWKKEEITGSCPHVILCSDQRDVNHEIGNCPLLNRSEDTAPFDAVWVLKSGNYIDLDVTKIVIPESQGLIKTLFCFSDNAQKKYSQAELIKFSTLVENNPSPMLELNENSIILYSNQVMTDFMSEYGFDDLGQFKVLPLYLNDIIEKCVSTMTAVHHVEHEVAGHWFLWDFFPYSVLGECRVQVNGTNITERKKAIEEKDKAEAISAKKRSEIRREYFAKMTHELRSPLNSIVGFTNILLKRLDGEISEKYYQLLTQVKQGGLKLSEQINNTLEMSKIEAGKISIAKFNTEITDIIKEVVTDMAPLAIQKSLSLRVLNLDLPVWAEIDGQKIRQVVINLASNAIKYTLDGFVQISLEQEVDAELGKTIVITVEDSGIGIKQEDQSKLFKNYSQLVDVSNRNVEGTGLGLAFVYEIVTLHNGRIDLFSKYEKGTLIKVVLPVTSANA